MEVREHRVHPDNAEHAGAQDHDDHGDSALAKATGGGDGAVHKRGDAVGNAHDRQTVHTRVHHLRVCGKEAQERPSKQQQSQTQKQSRTEGVSRADQEGPADTVLLACAVVLTDETAAGGVEGLHHIIHQRVGVGSSGVSRHHGGAEGIDATLDEQIGQRENGVLQSGRDTDG